MSPKLYTGDHFLQQKSTYVQETGCSGRNGSDAVAILHILGSKKYRTSRMRHYIESTSSCR